MRAIFIIFVCFVSLCSYGSSSTDLSNVLQNLPPVPENSESLDPQTSSSVISEAGYRADHELEGLFGREISCESFLSDFSASISPIQTCHIEGAEMFLHNGQLFISFPKDVRIDFSKIIICQDGTMCEYRRKIGHALIYPEQQNSDK